MIAITWRGIGGACGRGGGGSVDPIDRPEPALAEALREGQPLAAGVRGPQGAQLEGGQGGEAAEGGGRGAREVIARQLQVHQTREQPQAGRDGPRQTVVP